MPNLLNGRYSERDSQILWEDDERVFRRGWRLDDGGNPQPALLVVPAAEHPSPSTVDQFRHEYELKHALDPAWAVRPLELHREAERIVLVLEDPGGEPLDRLVGAPMEIGSFLRLAIGVAAALGKLHQRGVVHKDIKPVHILANEATGEVHLTGFGIASRLARERQSPRAPETLAGTLAYMAPEQTGRMNRSVDSRSDLYALGVMMYQMLTGSLPFAAGDAMEWVHCHLARRPVPPVERRNEIPGVISAIVVKLLAKKAEDRYQTAAGLNLDLRRCQSEWEKQHRIDEFGLGEHDTSDRLLIPERLYGREREVETLLAAFNRVVNGGAPELVLLSGYSGIGKSSVVNELQPVLLSPRGLFASGKFDQHKRDIPYSTLAQAFQSLLRPLLGKREPELEPWRDALREMLGSNAGLIVDLVPELKLIIGDPPPVPELPLQDAQRRFQLVCRQFIGVFARPEHPLALFLDDLQWLDAATLEVLEDLLSRADLRNLILVGAYRDNEVNAAHPLMRKLETIRASGRVQEIKLGPLTAEDLAGLVGDALRCDAEQAEPLARLVHAKTDGNPFFVIQFLYVLADEGLLAFDHERGRWSWDLGGIHAKRYTDNVVELVTGKLTRLPLDAQDALRQLACLGNVVADVSMLSIVLGMSEDQVHAALWDAVRQQLVERIERSYKFVHDRVQEAVYALISEKSRAEAHLTIGRLLAAHTPPEKRDEAIFEIVNQLNRGAPLMTSQDEREQLAELNLAAGKRAKGAAAWASALNYLIAGIALVPEDVWERRHDLIFELELYRAECEFLTGEMTSAEEHLRMISSRAADMVQRAAVACLLADLYFAFQQPDRAVAECLECLRHAELDIPMQATEVQAQAAYDRVCSRLDGLGIDELAVRPLITDPTSRAILDVLAKITPSALVMHKHLVTLIVCAAVDISLDRGHCDSSCFAYAFLGFIAGWKFGDFEAGFRFARLGYELVERKDLRKFEGSVGLHLSGPIMPWARHIATCRELIRTTFAVANKTGDRLSAAASCNEVVQNLLFAGEPLVEVEKEAEVGLEFCRRAAFSAFIDRANIVAAFVRSLRGLTRLFGSFDDERFDEHLIQTHFESQPHLLACEFWYWARRLQARFFAGDYPAALDASIRAQRLRSESPGALELVDHELYSALTRAAVCDSASPDERQRHLYAAAAHLQQLEAWARHCPENFENRAALVGAEIARIESRDLDAMRLYELAIRSARANGFVHNEALAYERASAFYRARGFDQFADTYLRNARACYAAWGADGKVRQLDRLYPGLKQDPPSAGLTSTITASAEGLDLATVIQVSQAVSGEIVLERLLDIVIRKAMEHAGAERGVLIVPHGDELQVAVEAKTSGNDVVVDLGEAPAGATGLPDLIVRYVIRTHESVILDDASSSTPFSADPYVLQHRVRSVLCLPLLNQAKLAAILYLENNLAPRVFTSERITVLRLLASQAATSLENTRLYRDLEDREARIRRLVDANIMGILVADLEGRIVEANDAFLRIVGYDREDLLSGRVLWDELTPPEWRERDLRGVEELTSSGTLQAYEKEYFRRDGSRVPVLMGAALFKEGGNEGVAFVLDLTERKRAEQALRQLESDLAHVNRLSMLGELTASLAHEVKQPIATARNNARAAHNFLSMQPPDLDEVREAIGCIVGDVDRAGDIIDRISEQIKKAPLRKDQFDLNAAISEVIGLARSTTMKNGVSVVTRLTDGLLAVQGDRVQLQQVVLNLILNAVEAMGSVEAGARELLISTGQDRTGVLVAVRDSGPGIGPEHLESVFQSFYTTKPGGTGMGLSVCRSIIHAHGGRLWADANKPRGAVFRFTLPRTERSS